MKLMDCGSLQVRDEVLAMDGWSIRERFIKVSAHSRRMSLSDIFRWVHGQLTVWESEAEFIPSRIREVEIKVPVGPKV